jgi:hypothetical protein
MAQQRDFEATLAGLRDEFRLLDIHQDGWMMTVAASYALMAALWRYENIAAAEPAEAEHLKARREQLRRVGLCGPTIPGPREVLAIARYQGRLDRAIRGEK